MREQAENTNGKNEDMDSPILLFVYGSLLRGEANHRLLETAEFVGPAGTPPEYRLVDLGPYPGLVAAGGTAVLGEVYQVPPGLIPRLDRLEDHPDVYVRSDIRLDDGRPVVTYLLREHLALGKPEVSTDRKSTRLNSSHPS